MIFKKRKKKIESEPQPIVGINIYRNKDPVTVVDTYSVTATELKPCPYCGGDPTTAIKGALYAEPTIRCSKCRASVYVKCANEPPTFSEATDAMIKAMNKWNTRASQKDDNLEDASEI